MSPRGRVAMLTLRASSSQRAEVVRNRVTEPTTATTRARATSHVGGEGADGIPSEPPRRSLAPVRSCTDTGRDCTGVTPSTVAAPGAPHGPATNPNQVPDDPAPLP